MREDTPEEIQHCLSCEKKTCTNCLNLIQKSRPYKRPKAVEALKDGRVVYTFPSIKEAAQKIGCAEITIRKSIQNHHPGFGYTWRYVCG